MTLRGAFNFGLYQRIRLFVAVGVLLFGFSFSFPALAQPANDLCANATLISFGSGEFGLGTFNQTVGLGAATTENGEFFTEVNRIAGNTGQSVWYRFKLPTARKMTISATSNSLPADGIGISAYQSTGCLPDSLDWVASGLPAIGTQGSIFDQSGCVPAGDYLIQITAKSGVEGVLDVKFEVSSPTIDHDLPTNAFNYGTVSGTSITQSLDVGCLTIANAAEKCTGLGTNFTQTSWAVFTTDNFVDKIQILLNTPFGKSGNDSIGYRIYEGNALTTPTANLPVLVDCQTLELGLSLGDSDTYTCEIFKPNKVYTIQFFFPADAFYALEAVIQETGKQATISPNPQTIPGGFQLGTLNDNQPVQVQDYFACNSLMANNACPPLAPPFVVLGTDTFRYAIYLTFTVPTDGVLNIQKNDPFALVQLYQGDPATGCNLTPVDALGEIGKKPLCSLQPSPYTLQIMSKDVGRDLTATLTFLQKSGFADPGNPNDLGVITSNGTGTPDVIPCDTITLPGIGGAGGGGGGGPGPGDCYGVRCGGKDNDVCPKFFELCNTTVFNRYLFRVFEITQPSIIEIKNVLGEKPFVVCKGKVNNTAAFPLFARSSCTNYYRTNPCELDSAGWYTVITFGTEQDAGTPSNVQVTRLNVPTTTQPQFNRPFKAAKPANANPIKWIVNGLPDAPTSLKAVALPPETFSCVTDTPYVYPDVLPCCPSWRFNRVAYYVFTLEQESYLRVAISQGDTNIITKLYNVDVRQDSTLLGDPTRIVQPCNRCGVTEFCRLQPGTYTIVAFVNHFLIGKAITPAIAIDRVVYSKFDHAINAGDVGIIPPNQVTKGERDYFSCATGAQPYDPPFGKDGSQGTCNTGNVNFAGSNIPYPVPPDYFMEPFWKDSNRTCNEYGHRKTLWYTFQVYGAGKVKVAVKHLSPNVPFNSPYTVYRAFTVDGTVPFSQLKAIGKVDSTIIQGLAFVKNNDAGGCTITDTLSFEKDECEPVRYYVVINNALVNYRTFMLEPSFEYIPDGVSAGDFCQNAIPLAIAMGSDQGTVTVNCHTIGEGYGEDGSNMSCLFGPEGFVSSWFKVHLQTGVKSDLTVQLAENTNASANNIRYRILYGSCNALTPGECVSSFSSGFTLNCLPDIDYYVQVVGPKGYEGTLTLTATAVPTVNQGCKNEIKLLKADFEYEVDCRGSVVKFLNQSTAGDVISYLWQFDTTKCCDTSTFKNPQFIFPQTNVVDTFWVKLIVRNSETGGVDSLTLPVVIYPPAGVESIAGAAAFCEGDSILITAPSGYPKYLWNTGDTTQSIFVKSAGDFMVELNYGDGCVDQLTKTVTETKVGALTANPAQVCAGERVVLQVSPEIAGGEALWFEADTLAFVGETFEIANLTQPRTFKVRYAINGCTLQTPVSVLAELRPAPVAKFVYSPQKVFLPPAVVNFENQTTFGADEPTYFWDFGDQTVSSEKNPVHQYGKIGAYTVQLVAADPVSGCPDTFALVVDVAVKDSVYIPNVFTPNDNGPNNAFFPLTNGVERYDLQVFDRWGILVFDNKGVPTTHWNGRLHNTGGQCAEGVYYFVAKFYFISGKIFDRTGNVMLVR